MLVSSQYYVLQKEASCIITYPLALIFTWLDSKSRLAQAEAKNGSGHILKHKHLNIYIKKPFIALPIAIYTTRISLISVTSGLGVGVAW